MIYELHVTTAPDVDIDSWVNFCEDVSSKPLRIELEGGGQEPVQVMNAIVSEFDSHDEAIAWMNSVCDTVRYVGFPVWRAKLEVPLDKSAEFKTPVYHEAHVKSLVHPDDVQDMLTMASRFDWAASTNTLYPSYDGMKKWYLTKRAYDFSYLDAAAIFNDNYADLILQPFHTVRMEKETVVVDSNPRLDAGWA